MERMKFSYPWVRVSCQQKQSHFRTLRVRVFVGIKRILSGLCPLFLALMLFACGGQGGGTEVGNPPSPSQGPSSGVDNPPAAPSGENPPPTQEDCEQDPRFPALSPECMPKTNPFNTPVIERDLQNNTNTQNSAAAEDETEVQS